MSKKLTKENRAALQSVRAKARKALAVNHAPLPKAIIAHFEAVITFVDSKLASKASKAEAKAVADDAPEATVEGDVAQAA